MKEVCLFIHIVFASIWLGGMLFMALVLAPFVRNLPNSVEIFKKVGIRYSIVGTFIGLPILFITGICNTNSLGYNFLDIFKATASNPYLFTLKHKVYLFFLTSVLAVIHDIFLGLRSDKNEKYRKGARIIGIINLIIALIIVYLASKLRLGV